MELAEILTGFVTGTLTVPVVKWILGRIADEKELSSGQKRMLAVLLSFVLGTGGFFALIFAGYASMPIDCMILMAWTWACIIGWIEALLPVWASAFTASQIVLSAIRARVPNYGK